LAVILVALGAAAAQILSAQAKRPSADKGPRALGLLELAPNGKSHLIPVVIMYDGEFYDASVYKASPVPMALDPGTVYEAERSGKSLGLFTITGALQGHNNTWTAEGIFEPPGAKRPSKGKIAESEPRDIEEQDAGPPKLRRPASEKPKAPEPAPASPPPGPSSTASPASPSTPTASPPASPPPAQPAPPPPAAASPAAAKPAPPATPAPKQEDVYRPVLRRGKAEWTEPPAAAASPKASAPPGKHAIAASSPSGVQIIPAISDAGGPEPRPYTYPMKPDEEQQLRKKTLAMAAEDVLSRVRQLESATTGPATQTRTSSRSARARRAPRPVFDNVQLHVFDLSLSNEPVVVLTATAQVPQSSGSTGGLEYYVALVAHADIYGDLHKAFSQVTDNRHLDVLARYEFVDAVDADGDGRAELLFRRVSEAGKAYTVFRLIGDQVWPLFEGTPGQ
jgi:hypothetical protein